MCIRDRYNHKRWDMVSFIWATDKSPDDEIKTISLAWFDFDNSKGKVMVEIVFNSPCRLWIIHKAKQKIGESYVDIIRHVWDAIRRKHLVKWRKTGSFAWQCVSTSISPGHGVPLLSTTYDSWTYIMFFWLGTSRFLLTCVLASRIGSEREKVQGHWRHYRWSEDGDF